MYFNVALGRYGRPFSIGRPRQEGIPPRQTKAATGADPVSTSLEYLPGRQ